LFTPDEEDELPEPETDPPAPPLAVDDEFPPVADELPPVAEAPDDEPDVAPELELDEDVELAELLLVLVFPPPEGFDGDSHSNV
jgi:hypothetical protein